MASYAATILPRWTTQTVSTLTRPIVAAKFRTSDNPPYCPAHVCPVSPSTREKQKAADPLRIDGLYF